MWNLQSITSLIPIETLELICAIHAPCSSASEDLIIWIGDPNGSFSYKGAYHVIKDHSNIVMEDNFWWIWKWPGHEHLRCFMWKVDCGCYLTNIQQVCRRMTNSDLCPICGNASESILLIFCDCQLILEVWHYVLHVNLSNGIFTADLNKCSWII